MEFTLNTADLTNFARQAALAAWNVEYGLKKFDEAQRLEFKAADAGDTENEEFYAYDASQAHRLYKEGVAARNVVDAVFPRRFFSLATGHTIGEVREGREDRNTVIEEAVAMWVEDMEKQEATKDIQF